MLRYEIINSKSKNTGNPYTLIRLTFLMKDGTTYVIDKFATKEEAKLLTFVASEEEIQAYLQNQEQF